MLEGLPLGVSSTATVVLIRDHGPQPGTVLGTAPGTLPLDRGHPRAPERLMGGQRPGFIDNGMLPPVFLAIGTVVNAPVVSF